MPTETSTLRINDEFSKPLEQLSQKSYEAERAVSDVSEALVEQDKYLSELTLQNEYYAESIKNDVCGSLEDLDEASSKTFDNLSKSSSEAFDAIKRNVDYNAEHLKNTYMQVQEIGKKGFDFAADVKTNDSSFEKWGKRITLAFAGLTGGIVGVASSFLTRKLITIGEEIAGKIKGIYVSVFGEIKNIIEGSFAELSLTDKFSSMFGEVGQAAKNSAYRLANEIGENATMVAEMSAKAAYQGIGTDDFERMMKLADKVGTLSAGETTESVANTLLSNLKSGHDASTVAQMFGGGEVMERQLRRAGYERALDRGDLQGALSIAEKIAEQAGLTDEKYQQATGTLTENFKSITNTAENIMARIKEGFAQSFAPTVERVKKLLESDKFKKIVEIVEVVTDKVGQAANWIADQMIDAAEWVIDKIYSIYEAAQDLIEALPIISGMLIAGIQYVENIWTNVSTFFENFVENIPKALDIVWLNLKLGAVEGLGFIKSKIGDLLGWVVSEVADFLKDSPLAKLFDIDVDELTKSAQKWTVDMGSEERRIAEDIKQQLDGLNLKQAQYVDLLQGYDEAFEFGKNFMQGYLDKILGQLRQSNEAQGKIESDTNKIRRYNEREEELGWLKAFSDRQIMSSYNQSTSYSRNVTINGLSESGRREVARLNVSARSSRSAAI